MGNRLQKHNQEGIVCWVLWLLVFFEPIVDYCLKVSNNQEMTFNWLDLMEVWIQILPYLFLFLLNHFVLFPYLVLRKHMVSYVLILVSLLTLFYLGMRWERISHLDKTPPRPHRELKEPQFHPAFDERKTAPPLDNFFPPKQRPPHRSMPFLEPELMKLILAILMLGLNLAIKYYFKSQRDEEVMRELEKQNLQQELQYLKYQINPHFFMNTLNNIHALIDINREKAKSSILELSRLMRHILYEGASRTIPITHELEFLNHYITLMRLRFTENVSIEVDFPEKLTDVNIPPLLLIPFVENAFKHGVSYQKKSFVQLALRIEDEELFFRCVNSRYEKKDDLYSGIGLENVRKRLSLLYQNNYTLNIERTVDTFHVLLVIPVSV